MKRTKEEAEQTRLRILDAALLEFSEKGYSASSLNSVADRISLTKGAVYWHFRSKKALFDELIEVKSENANLELRSIFESKEKALVKIEHYLSRYLALLEEDKDYAAVQRVLFFHIENSEELRQEYEEKARYLATMHNHLSQLLGMAEKEEKKKLNQSASMCAYALLGYSYGLANTWLFYPGGLSMKKDSNRFSSLILNGIFS